MPVSEEIRRIRTITQVDPDMSLQQLHCLLVIATEPEGTSLTAIANKVGITVPTASRYVSALGKVDRHHREGLKLVEAFEDPMERRRKIIRLTNKGKAFINKVYGEFNADLSTRNNLHGLGGEWR
jgi:DNA-binding MarR family transcriptional regulator